ncbi:MAG: heme exporter protein CcmB [Zoogloeaceae bacterium]|jgi:heme exporter protein B|nr:heme exporter protein CcmB [Zoogloeaceae bacterium]
MLSFTARIIRRDLSLAFRRPADLISPLCFFLIVASLFPLGIGPEPELLRRLAPGILWVGALLSTLLSLSRMFADDFADGTLEQIALAPYPFGLAALGKTLSHWMVSGLPLALLSPILGLQFDLPVDALGVLFFSLLIGTPALSGIGAIGAGLTLGLRGGAVLISLIVLPLYIPALILGASAVDAAMTGISPRPHLFLLAAFSTTSIAFAPWAAAAALKISLE